MNKKKLNFSGINIFSRLGFSLRLSKWCSAIIIYLVVLTASTAAQQIRQVKIFSPSAGNASSNEVAVVNSTGLVYNYGQGFGNNVGVIDPATNTLIKSIRPTDPNNLSLSRFSRVNQTTNIVYFLRDDSLILPIDGRPASSTFNQSLPLISFSNQTISTFSIDQTRNLLYASTRTTGSNPVQSQIQIVDINPANATFNQSIGSVALPSGQSIGGIAVNSTTNKIYAASSSTNGGVFVLNRTTQNLTLIAGTSGANAIAINVATNMIYAARPFTGTGVSVINGATDTLTATVSLPNIRGGASDNYIAINSTTGRIYLVSNDSSVSVLDGNPASATFNSVIAAIPNVGLGSIALDEGTNKIVGTSGGSLKTTIIDGVTNTVAATTFGNFSSADVAVNPVTHRAYVAYVFYTTQAINLNDNSYTNIETTVETGESIVNPNNNLFYFARNGATSNISFLNTDDTVGSVTGLPHNFGRYIFAAQNTVTNRVYAVNSGANIAGTDTRPNYLSVINGATNNIIANVELGGQPFGNPTVNEATDKVYLLDVGFGSTFPSKITVINGATNTASVVDTSAFPANSSFLRTIVANPVTNRIYFQVSEGTSMGVINGATDVAMPLPGYTGVFNILVNPNLNRIYFFTSTGIRVLDGSNDTQIANIALTGTSRSAVINKTTGRIFVLTQNQTLTAVDGNTNTIVSTVPLANSLSSIAVNEATNRLYLGTYSDFNDESTSAVLFVNGDTLAVESTLPIPLRPSQINVNPAMRTIYVRTVNASQRTGLVVISDTLPCNSCTGSAFTPVSTNVSVAPVNNLNIRFSNITQSGNTTATPLSQSQLPSLPAGYSFVAGSTAYEIQTSATNSGNITVTFQVPNVTDAVTCNNLRSLHYKNGAWATNINATPVYEAGIQTCTVSQTVTSLSPFAVARYNAPTAATVNVGGRLITTTGRGIANVRITMTDAGGNIKIAMTTSFGYYRFDDVRAGETYIITARSKRFAFSQSSQVLNINEDHDDIDFIESSNFIR